MNGALLSARQREVVEHGEGSLLVVAGPGSGKTRVLTERVRRLLTESSGHFRVLALTFTNKAANEMAERLADLGDARQRATISTLHGFCLDMLADRGKPIGVQGLPQIFERAQDRRQVLLEAVMADPLLAAELMQSGDAKARARRVDEWLKAISLVKAHPISHGETDDPLEERIIDAYNAGLRASGAYDFDDLLLLAYRLMTEFTQVADFYRRLFGYICVDEAQDLNEAQYAVLQALCGPEFRNVMMVGDPKQSIYGFNTSSPIYMDQFVAEFGAKTIELTENYRCSRAVVQAALALEPRYTVHGQLPISGEIGLLVGKDESHEATLVCDRIEQLIANGHPDIEGNVTPSRCAILGRTRYSLLLIEAELKKRGVPFFKRLSSAHENESDLVNEFQLALRVLANPQDRLHLAALAKSWGETAAPTSPPVAKSDPFGVLRDLAQRNGRAGCATIVEAIDAIASQVQRLDLIPGLEALRRHADTQDAEERRAVYDDTEVIRQEWDQYLRSHRGSGRTIAGFMSGMALGTTQHIDRDSVALLTVHSAKGLEFDVVFVVGMAEGVFPDFRSKGNRKATAEETRNAFVAITRSKRLLYLTYPRTRRMPWGDVWSTQPSQYLRTMRLV
jgi:DNA helicase-2/ATP-dependent DNA helicase PcrA